MSVTSVEEPQESSQAAARCHDDLCSVCGTAVRLHYRRGRFVGCPRALTASAAQARVEQHDDQAEVVANILATIDHARRGWPICRLAELKDAAADFYRRLARRALAELDREARVPIARCRAKQAVRKWLDANPSVDYALTVDERCARLAKVAIAAYSQALEEDGRVVPFPAEANGGGQ